jgi:hypothetical protein
MNKKASKLKYIYLIINYLYDFYSARGQHPLSPVSRYGFKFIRMLR